jgi:lipooligosaccharide transport system ATP-binding protein
VIAPERQPIDQLDLSLSAQSSRIDIEAETPAEELAEIEELPVDITPDIADDDVPLIVARDLVKAYADEPVVKGIDFEVRRGECLGVLGPNGAGKTTTINMIACFVSVGSGELDVFGYPVKGGQRQIKSRLGIVSQENNLDPDLKVLKNLLVFGRYFGLPYGERRLRAEELLEFSDKRDAHIRELSGGMQRRLTLARALISNPELLILDEPTTGLDPQARHVVWQKLRALNRAGVTMLLTTHYMEEAEQLCDRLLIMDRGEIVVRGSPADLISEHIGAEVIECFLRGGDDEEAIGALHERADHVEQAGDEVYGFFRDADAARAILPRMASLDFIHRRATLEDVFLKLTGRELRD